MLIMTLLNLTNKENGASFRGCYGDRIPITSSAVNADNGDCIILVFFEEGIIQGFIKKFVSWRDVATIFFITATDLPRS